jgi:hypothetical protein
MFIDRNFALRSFAPRIGGAALALHRIRDGTSKAADRGEITSLGL